LHLRSKKGQIGEQYSERAHLKRKLSQPETKSLKAEAAGTGSTKLATEFTNAKEGECGQRLRPRQGDWQVGEEDGKPVPIKQKVPGKLLKEGGC